jgi:hypothetical protein
MARVLALLALALLVVGALSACGGGGGGGGGGAGSVSAGEYADTVCGSLNTWLGAVKERASTVTDALSPTSSPDEGKQVLGDYLDGIIDDTDTMVSTIRDSGAPDVDNGAGISDTLVKALESTEKTFQAARDQVDSLPTQSVEAFRAAAQVLAQSIQTHISEVGTALQSISSADLDAAFTSSSECRKLSSASG